MEPDYGRRPDSEVDQNSNSKLNSDPPSIAKRLGVTSFDLVKKQQVIDASEAFLPERSTGIGVFCALVNALHYDGDSGQLVSAGDVKEILLTATTEAAEAFIQFASLNHELVGDNFQ